MKKTARVLLWLLLTLLVGIAIAGSFYFDAAVRAWIVAHDNRALAQFMRLVSRAGDWPEHVAAGLLIAAIAWQRGNKRWLRIGLTMIAACALAGVSARAVKITAARGRPSVRREQASTVSRFSSKYNSFPSGHTAVTSAVFGVLVFSKRRLGIWLVPLPLLVAISRVWVGAHYLSDVVCGAVLGIFCAWFCVKAFVRRES